MKTSTLSPKISGHAKYSGPGKKHQEEDFEEDDLIIPNEEDEDDEDFDMDIDADIHEFNDFDDDDDDDDF